MSFVNNNKFDDMFCEKYDNLEKENKNLRNEIKDLEQQINELETDLAREEKKVPFLRSTAKTEYDLKNEIFAAFQYLVKERKSLIIQFNSYTFLKNLLFIIVAMSAPMAFVTNKYMDTDISDFYLWAQTIMALAYFLLLPDFVCEDNKAIELPKEVKELYMKYKTHQKEINYMDMLADNC